VRTRKTLIRVVATVSLAGLGLLAIVVVQGRRSSAKDTLGLRDLPSVAVALPRRENVPIVLQALGTVTPLSAVTVKSQVSGYLLSLTDKEGQLIRKGEFLAQIDPRPYQAGLAQAQGQLIRDEAFLKNARLDLERYRQLVAQDSTSRQVLDTAQATVGQYEGTVRSDRAQVQMQRLNLEYCRILSPTDGRVGLRLQDPGNLVQPADSTGLMMVTRLQPISVVFVLPQVQLQSVLKQMDAHEPLEVAAIDSENVRTLATGTLAAIDSQVDTSTGTVKLRALFTNSDLALFPNEFVNVRLTLDTVKNGLTVATAAIRGENSSHYVYTVNAAARASVRRIVTGPEYRGRTLVTVGLSDSDRIVTEGFSQVEEGVQVSVVAVRNPQP
jgi:membrane fusion protein, multidrug efflux system